VNAVSETSIKSRRRLDREEIYELGLALELAEKLQSEISQRRYRWPLRLYKERVVGQAYTAERSLDINLHDLVEFGIKYVETWRSTDPKPKVELGMGAEKKELNPLKGLVIVAEKELSSSKGIKGDNEMAALLLVKDLHRSISSGRTKLVEESLYRTIRKARGLQDSKDVDKSLKNVLRAFCSRNHLDIVLEATS